MIERSAHIRDPSGRVSRTGVHEAMARGETATRAGRRNHRGEHAILYLSALVWSLESSTEDLLLFSQAYFRGALGQTRWARRERGAIEGRGKSGIVRKPGRGR